MTAATAVGLAVVWPLLAVVLIIVFRNRPNLRETGTLLTGGSLFAIVAGVILPSVRGSMSGRCSPVSSSPSRSSPSG